MPDELSDLCDRNTKFDARLLRSWTSETIFSGPALEICGEAVLKNKGLSSAKVNILNKTNNFFAQDPTRPYIEASIANHQAINLVACEASFLFRYMRDDESFREYYSQISSIVKRLEKIRKLDPSEQSEPLIKLTPDEVASDNYRIEHIEPVIAPEIAILRQYL